MMVWNEVDIDDWLVTTAELRKYKGLNKIRLTTKHRDIRYKICKVYDNYEEGLEAVVTALGIRYDSFFKRCRGDTYFQPHEQEILTEMLSLTEEEKEKYFAE